MAFWDRVKTMMTVQPVFDDVAVLQTRAIDSFADMPGLTEQLLRVQGLSGRPWRAAGLREALGVPSVFRAVSLIANTTGALSLEGFRKGQKLADVDRPRIIVRPSPLSTPRDFFRDTAYAMATRGEAWWWIAKRDLDGSAMSLWMVNPAEITVTENQDDLRFPTIEWRGKKMPNADMIQITYLREPGGLRGIGPLQMCGAAVSVAVESQEWAANFFAGGGYPSLGVKTQGSISREEAIALRELWMEVPPNMPHFYGEDIEEVKEFRINQQGAQMLQAREFQTGDVARMFGIPGSMLDHTAPGSNLTYQNLETEFAKFVRGCLWPNYLEPIEQTMSDLLTRSTVARFNVDALQRAEMKARFESYKLAADVLPVDEAAEFLRRSEGMVAGDVENAPVPAAPPQAVPTSLPIQGRTEVTEVRCDGKRILRGVIRPCNKLLAEAGPFVGTCPRCRKQYEPAAA